MTLTITGDTDYSAVYVLVVTGPTATPTSVVPINYVSSGAQIKYKQDSN